VATWPPFKDFLQLFGFSVKWPAGLGGELTAELLRYTLLVKNGERWLAAAAGTAAVLLVATVAALYRPAELAEDVAPAPTVPPPVRAVFVGDIMLDRGVARHAARKGERSLVSDDIRALFAGADLRVGNLEGTITASSSVALVDASILRFTFAPTLAETFLRDLNFSAVSSANNHGLDFGEEGLAETRENLKRWSIATFGDPLNGSDEWASIDVRGKTVCLVGYHDLFAQNSERVAALLAKIEPECWRSAVVAHWGEEYQAAATDRQRLLARQFVDAGADLVIGAHPHVVQPSEIYRGVPIFYSLGNFVFDQDFSWATTHGIAVVAEFGDDGTRVTPIALASREMETGLAGEEEWGRVLGALEMELAGGTVSVPRE